jgi:hypothetical protein
MRSLLLTTLVVLSIASVQAKEADQGHFTELVGVTGKIDWTAAVVSATGYGVAPAGKNPKVAPLLACRAAIVDAQRNLLESFQGVRVTSTTLVSNYMLSSDQVKSSVEGTVQGARIKSRENRLDGSCKVQLQAPLRGRAANAVYQDIYQGNSSAFNLIHFFSNFIGTAHAASYPLKATDIAAQVEQLTKRVAELERKIEKGKPDTPEIIEITGVVIDVSGSQFIPSLDPKIRKASGDILYPTKKDATNIINTGQLVSLFATNVDFAMEHPMVGNSPVLLKARQTWKEHSTEIVLSDSDAQKMAFLVSQDLLKNTNVIIVLD